MKANLMFILLFLNLHVLSFGQEFKTDSLAQVEITRLQFMTGCWIGTGWMMGRDGQKHSFNLSENIQFKVDSTLLLIEGIGKS